MQKRYFSLVLLGLIQTSLSYAAPGCSNIDLDFSGKANSWRALPLSSLKRDTQYSVAAKDGRNVLEAKSDNSASLYGVPLKPAAQAYGFLDWQWQTDALIPGADNRDKSKEDSPVRVIVAFDGDKSRLTDTEKRHFKWAKRMSGREPPYATLMYIWSEQVAPETIITSAHTTQVKMIVVSSGTAGLGQWQSLHRDLRADYKRAFDEDAGPVLGVGVMTDTDNTGGKATARYAGIRLECAR